MQVELDVYPNTGSESDSEPDSEPYPTSQEVRSELVSNFDLSRRSMILVLDLLLRRNQLPLQELFCARGLDKTFYKDPGLASVLKQRVESGIELIQKEYDRQTARLRKHKPFVILSLTLIPLIVSLYQLKYIKQLLGWHILMRLIAHDQSKNLNVVTTTSSIF